MPYPSGLKDWLVRRTSQWCGGALAAALKVAAEKWTVEDTKKYGAFAAKNIKEMANTLRKEK